MSAERMAPVNPWSVPVVVASVVLERAACGFVCKRCGEPLPPSGIRSAGGTNEAAPQGVGYAAVGVEAAAASEGLTRCACGYSVHADVLEEGGQR